MALSNSDRERIADSVLKIQSARQSLEQLEEGKLLKADEIEEYLDAADHNLRVALGYARDKD